MAPAPDSIRHRVEQAVAESPRHLDAIYAFVGRFRPAAAEETIRARIYEGVEAGRIRRVAPGVYFARSGPATLLLVEGDAREALARLDEGSIDAIITDPPYDLGTRKHALSGTTRPHQGKGRTYPQWDMDAQMLRQMLRVLRKDRAWNTIQPHRRATGVFPRGGGAMLLFAPPITRSTWPHIRDLIDLAESVGFVFYGTLTWDHARKGMGYDCGRNQKNELLLFTAGPRNGLLWDLALPNVIREPRVQRKSGEHEAEKPVALFVRLVRAMTRKGDVVFDPFVGRGRWIRAVLQEGRHVVAMDRNGAWIRRILADLQQTSLGP